MSTDTKRKRLDLSPKKEKVEVVVDSPTITKESTAIENANVPPEEFDWEAYEATCPTRFRKPNPHIKTRNGDKVFSRESYAQELYNKMEENEILNPLVYSIEEGASYTGKVYGIDTEWASIDVGYRELIYVNLSRENTQTLEVLKLGAEVDVQLVSKSGVGGAKHMLGSVSAGLKTKIIKDIISSIEAGTTAYTSKVLRMIPGGGYILDIQGIECFMPGSLAGINKLVDFESIIGEDMYVVPVSYSPEKGTVVVSHRAYLRALIPNKLEEISKDISIERIGNVTGSAKYGVFVEFEGCLTGMIHVNDLDMETGKAHRERSIEPGTEIKFFVKEVISERKITLVQGAPAEKKVDPWEGISTRYTEKTEVIGIVKSTKDYGLFIEIEEGVVGLLHISEFPDNIDIKTIDRGANITVQVVRVEEDTRKVFLKL